ncbi:MAG: hypothetical protein BMS9Abin26_1754 [Gammaproteobacteria bacterium]|nr:MAG: hypothetical protein BMS9Abin26_1754 [Gammaproteobacteria bacterium]
MSENMVDVTMHLDEDIQHEGREALRDKILQQNGVYAAAYHDDKPHLMIIEYDPDTINSSIFLNLAKDKGVHAELISL